MNRFFAFSFYFLSDFDSRRELEEAPDIAIVIAKKRRDEPDLTEILFWGKIQGTSDAYLICVGLQDRFAGVPAKKFYYL